MKSLVMILLGCLLVTIGAQAAPLGTKDSGADPGAPATHFTFNHQRSPISITQNVDPTIINSGIWTCGNTTAPNYWHTDEYYLRRYFFVDDALNDPTATFTVQSVDYGVRYYRYANLVAVADSIDYEITAYTMSIPAGADFTFANCAVLASQPVRLDHTFNGYQARNVVIGGSITDTENNDLVVALFTPITYYYTPQFRCSLASSTAGQYQPTYIAFECGTGEPETDISIGSATPLVEVVNGDIFVPPPTGSCCAPDGSCTVVEEAQCVAPSIWTLAGICDPNTCPLPPGACCDPATGACIMVLQTECLAPSIWHSDWTCGVNQCPVPYGSCCMPDGRCTVTTQADCPGIWTINGVCEPNTCDQPSGACCNAATGACTFVQAADCAGQWLGMGVICTPNPCPQPTGGCCTNGICSQVVQAQCTGTWLGVGVVCTTTNCQPPVPVEHKSWGQVKHSYR